MQYQDLKTLFNNLNNGNDLESNIFGLHLGEKEIKDNYAVSISGDINVETNNIYANKINMFKNFKAVDFSIMGYGSKEYGVGNYDLIKDEWKKIKSLTNLDNLETITGKTKATESLHMTIAEISFNNETFYFVAFQEPTEKMYKNKKVYSVGNEVTLLKTNEFFTMTSNVDCIIDEKQKCFYSLRNKEVIDMFGLETVAKDIVERSISILDSWNFLSNSDIIKNNSKQKSIYAPLFKIMNDKDYLDKVTIMTPEKMKERLLRVADKEKINEESFKDNKLILTKSNRSYFLDLLSKKLKYNIATDTVED